MKILKPGAEWDRALAGLPESDIYFSSAYHASFEGSMRRRAVAYVYEAMGETFFYPFMMGEIGKIGEVEPDAKYYDIETVYGYSGPLASSADPEFLQKAYQAFHEYCAAENIVCEMVRYHPLLGNEKFAAAGSNVAFNRKTVSVSLDSKEVLWKNYNSKLRNKLNKAEKIGLRLVTEGVPLEKFIEAYEATMKRVGAESFYAFNQEHYKFIAEASNVKIFAVYDGNEALAVSAFMLHDEFIHYHLSGSAHDLEQTHASKFLIHKTAEWGIDNGFKTFHLGGGRGAGDDDALFTFKRRMGDKTHDFYIGKTIFNQAAYDNLVSRWRAQGGEAPASFLQSYRLPVKP